MFQKLVIGSLVVKISADAATFLAEMGKMEKSAKTSMKAVGKAVGLAVAGVTTLGIAGLREYAKFNQAMTESTSIMTGVTSEVRRQMEEVARSAARNGIQTNEELARSYYYLASAGLDAQQSMSALPAVQKFSTAGAFDMARATDLLTDAQSALGLTVKDASQNLENMSRVSDVLVKANTLANASVEQFSISLTSKAGAAMRQLNMDVEEGVAILAAYADQGVKAELAGERLNIVLRDLQTAAMRSKDEWRQFGVNVYDMQGNIRPVVDILSDLEVRMGSMSDEQKNATFEMLGFQFRSIDAIKSLMGLSDKVRGYEAELRKAGGTTQHVADEQLKSLSSQMKITRNRFNDILLIIGEKLAPKLLEFNDRLKGMYDETGRLKPQVQSLVDTFIGLYDIIDQVVNVFQFVLQWGRVSLTAIMAFWTNFANAIAEGAVWVLQKLESLTNAFNAFVENSINAVIDGMNSLLDKFDPSKSKFGQWLQAAANSNPMLGPFSAMLAGGEQLANKAQMGHISLPQYNFAPEDTGALGYAAEGSAEALEEQFQTLLDMYSDYWGEKKEAQTQAAEEEKEIARQTQEEITAIMAEQQAKQAEMEAEALRQRNAMVVSSAEEINGSLLSIAKDTVGEQSGIYKTLFAIGKAFAIADAIVKIQQGIANALSLPFPANLAAAAGVAASAAGVISTIKGANYTPASYEGGGYTPNGPRVGGVDGRGGRYALLHPNEKITDLKKNKESSGLTLNVDIVNNVPEAGVSVTADDDAKTLRIMVERIEQRLASRVVTGQGNFNKALQSTYALRRAGQ